MWLRLLAVAGAAALAFAALYALIGGGSAADGREARTKVVAAGPSKPVVAPRSPAEEEAVEAITAEPTDPDDEPALVLTAPDEASGWGGVPFEATWTGPNGATVLGTADLQRVDGSTWENIAEIEFGPDGGSIEAEVNESGIFRVAYGGSEGLPADASQEIVVLADGEMPSWITATAAPADDETATVTATWSTEGGVAIVGDLDLQRQVGDDEWETVTTVTTGTDSTASAEVDGVVGDRFRLVYDGGSRFASDRSDEAVVVGEDVPSIPVSTCSTGTEIDNLPYAAACHYTPVSVGTFVVAHDYLGNAWWNAMPMGTIVELEGEQGGLYEVVDREIAPGRGSALGPASNWACGDACDVILQTCQGSNTGFTWLREIG